MEERSKGSTKQVGLCFFPYLILEVRIRATALTLFSHLLSIYYSDLLGIYSIEYETPFTAGRSNAHIQELIVYFVDRDILSRLNHLKASRIIFLKTAR